MEQKARRRLKVKNESRKTQLAATMETWPISSSVRASAVIVAGEDLREGQLVRMAGNTTVAVTRQIEYDRISGCKCPSCGLCKPKIVRSMPWSRQKRVRDHACECGLRFSSVERYR